MLCRASQYPGNSQLTSHRLLHTNSIICHKGHKGLPSSILFTNLSKLIQNLAPLQHFAQVIKMDPVQNMTRWFMGAFTDVLVLNFSCGPKHRSDTEHIVLCVLSLDLCVCVCICTYVCVCIEELLWPLGADLLTSRVPNSTPFFSLSRAAMRTWRGFNCAIKVIIASPCLAKPISISYRSQHQNCPTENAFYPRWGNDPDIMQD